MIYELSKRQLNALNQDLLELRVVIPCPAEQPESIYKYARECLPSMAALISKVAVTSVVCAGRKPAEKTTLTDFIGPIKDEWNDSKICFTVSVIEVTLTPSKMRGRLSAHQWPGGKIALTSSGNVTPTA